MFTALGISGFAAAVVASSVRSGSGEVIFLGLGLGAFAASAAAFACARSCCSATMGVMTSMILMAANAAVEPKRARMGSDEKERRRASRVRAADGDDRRHSHRGGEEVDRLGGGVRHGVGTLVGTLVGIVGAVRDETLADDRAGGRVVVGGGALQALRLGEHVTGLRLEGLEARGEGVDVVLGRHVGGGGGGGGGAVGVAGGGGDESRGAACRDRGDARVRGGDEGGGRATRVARRARRGAARARGASAGRGDGSRTDAAGRSPGSRSRRARGGRAWRSGR